MSIVNSGWFGALLGVLGAIFGTVLSIVLYRRSKQIARLRSTSVDQMLVGISTAPELGRLELRFDGTVVPRVTSTVIGLWNDGTTTFRGEDIVARDPLRITNKGNGELLQVDVEAVTRDVNDARVEFVGLDAHILFDYLDRGDGLRVRAIHSGEPGDLELTGTLRGLPQGITKHQQNSAKPRWRESLEAFMILAFGLMILASIFYGIVRTTQTEGFGILLYFAGMIVVAVGLEILQRRVTKQRLAGVPSAVSDDPALLGQLTGGGAPRRVSRRHPY